MAAVTPGGSSGLRLSLTHLGLDDKRPVPSDGDLLLHDAEAVEAADEQPGAVQPQGEVHVVAGEALLVVLDVLTAVHVEEEEVVEVAFGEGLPLLATWRLKVFNISASL